MRCLEIVNHFDFLDAIKHILQFVASVQEGGRVAHFEVNRGLKVEIIQRLLSCTPTYLDYVACSCCMIQ